MAGRYVRVTATRLAPRKDDYIFALAELKVTDRSGNNVALGKPVTAVDSIESGERWAKANLTDGLAPSGPGAEEKAALAARREDLLNNRRRIRVHITNVVLHATTQLAHTRDIVRALSPGFTLERGYAIVQGPDRHIIRDSSQLNPEDVVQVRVASGSFSATVNQITAKDPA